MFCYFNLVRGYNPFFGKYDGLSFREVGSKLSVLEVNLEFIQVEVYLCVFGSFFMEAKSSVICIYCRVRVLQFWYVVNVYDEKEGTEYGALRDFCGYALGHE